ncbi:MAG TPA: DNA polymerase I [Eubacterium sp.]|jgi:DNA-directed DNA polymerase|nr:DNA polymerase I [Eubacterium sp.]HAZ86399.1 DNA polymerase I [Eubacterium sp.]
MKKLVLIDGHSILNRAFYGVPELTNSEGLHTNAVYGFLNIMFKILDEEKPDYLTVAFDLSAPTFRHKMYGGYKGTRKPMPHELVEQVPLIKEALTDMNVCVVTKEGYEADDILGTLAKRAEAEGMIVSVVSGDRDLLQLATDNIKIRIPKTKKGTTEIEDYNTAQVVETYGVTPVEFIDMKALMGDASDNIPGVPGIGEKTAGAIISKYHSIENAYEHVEELTPNKAKNNLKEYYEQAQLSKTLATININTPLEYSFENAGLSDMFTKDAYQLFKRLEFKSILSRFEKNVESYNDDELEKSFKIIEDLSDAEKVFTAFGMADSVGIFMVPDKNNGLFAVALSRTEDSGDGRTVYIPVGGFMTAEYLSDKTAELVHVLHENGKKACFINLKEQLDFLPIEESDGAEDTALMAYLLNPLKDTYQYDDIARDFLGMLVKSRADIMGKALYEESDKTYICACYNAYTAARAYKVLEQRLEDEDMAGLYENIEKPLVYALKEMESNGILVDKDGLIAYGDMLKEKIAVVEKEVYELAGTQFNINSPKQLGEVLFGQMGLPGGKKTKTGYSTSADVLEKLAPEHPVVGKVLEYRQLTKLNSTYADGLLQYIGEDGRIHGKFNQTITATGRISSTEPNLQNIPIRMELGSRIRQVFIPKPGFVFLDSDYSQIELRILAHMSEDENLIAAYNSDEDIHRITASQVFNTPLNEVTKAQRSNAKAVNFGIVYGISSFGLSQDLSISKKEAAKYIEKYFETYPKVHEFLNGLVSSAKEKGYSVTMFKRRRPIPELSSSNFMQRSFGERVAMNAPIQGTAADIIKLAMIGVYHKLKELGLKSKLILQVHDELLIETAKDEVDIVKSILDEQMKNAARLSVALVVDTNEGSNWLEAH